MIKIIHFSDLHLWRDRGWDHDFHPKRLLGRANLLLNRRRHFPPELVRAVVAQIARRTADAVVFSGDVTMAALREEFEDGRRLLTPLQEKWGPRLIMIPGNHDRYTPRATSERLFERSQGEQTTYPFRRTLLPGVGVVGLDHSVPRPITARGGFAAEDLDALAHLYREQEKESPFVIVVGHYPLIYPARVHDSWQHMLPRRLDLLRRLLDLGAPLYLHGHKHRRWALRATIQDGALTAADWNVREGGQGTVCVNAGSAGLAADTDSQRAGFVEISIEGGAVVGLEAVIVPADGPPRLVPASDSAGRQV